MKVLLKYTKLLAVLTSLLIFETALGQPISNSPSWFTYAREYVEKDRRLIDEPNAARTMVLQYLDERDAAANKLVQLPTLSTAELVKLVSSSDAKDRRVVLAAAMITGVNDISFVRTALKGYLKENDYLVKFYSHRMLAHLTNEQLKTVEADILRALESERVADALLEGIPNIIRLDRERARPLLVRYLKFGSPGLRRATVIHVVQMGIGYSTKVKVDLERQKAHEALMLLKEVEQSSLSR